MSKPLEADKAPRILFVTPVSPFTKASGAEQRSNLMLSALSCVGQVDVLQLRQAEQSVVSLDTQNGCNSVIALVQASNSPFTRYHPKASITRDIERLLDCKLSDYQLIVGRYVWPVCQLAIPTDVPVIVDLDDFRYRYSEQTPWSWPLAKERLAKTLAHQLVRKQLMRFNGAFTVSEQDSREVPGLPTALLPNVPMHTQVNPTTVPNTKNVVFVGSLWYGPNVEGINWFLKYVWPQVRSYEPTATLTLAGAAPPALRAQWETHSGVSAQGFAPDLGALYEQANLVVVPIHSGGGTNIKVLEAMAFGRPCLVTRLVAAAFGSQISDNKEMLVGKDANDFSAKTVAALRMEQSLQKIADAGHHAINKQFTRSLFNTCVANFAKTVLLKAASKNG